MTRMALNHIAISMKLDDRDRADVLAFYGSVFGWVEGTNEGEPGNPLIMYTGEFGEFVYLLPADEPLTCPVLDHFGYQVDTIAELEEIVARAKSYADDRVKVHDIHARTTHGTTHDYTLTSAYISYLLPLQIELQHLERIER